MTLPIAAAVAQAVVDKIQASALEHDFTPERSYADWELKLENMDLLDLRDIDKLHVDVVAHTTQQQQDVSARGMARFIQPVDIAVRRKFGQDKQKEDTGRIKIEEIDALVLLVQQLCLMFTQVLLDVTDYPGAVWDSENGGTSILYNPDQKTLREKRQFTGLIRIFFRVDAPLNVSSSN